MTKQVDWHRVEIEYRANKLSNRELGAEFGVSESAIRKKANEKGWVRDLSQYVSKRTQEKLVRRAVKDKEASDTEVVEEISDRNAQIVESHRADIKTARGCAAILLDELMDGTKNYQRLEELIEAQATEEKWSSDRRATVLRAVSLPTRTKTLVDLANSMRVLQGLERVAFGIDGRENEMSYEDRLKLLLDGDQATA